MTTSRLLDGLDPAQRDAVTTADRPLRILAPAGSGKTRVLTRLIAYGVETETVDPDRVLAVTFTRKAAGELRQRLIALGLPGTIAAGTFHAAAWTQLRQWWTDQRVAAPSLLRSRGAMLRRLARSEGFRLGDAGNEIDWAAARMIGPDRYGAEAARAGRRPASPPEQVTQLYRSYEVAKRQKRVVDFDDILRMVIHTLDTQPERARALRWRFRHFFVDEFQDVNPLQFRLLEAWIGGRSDLCVVGDPDQAIYGWNGADAGFLQDFEAIFPGAVTVSLDSNYRSTSEILAAATAVLPGPSVAPVTAEPGPLPEMREFESDVAEARWIAEAIRDGRVSGQSWSRHGVLVRTHSQATTVAEALSDAGIPVRIRGAAGTATGGELHETLGRLPAHATLEVALVDWATDEAEGRGGPATESLLRLGHEFRAIQPEAGIDDFASWIGGMVADDDRGTAASDRVDIATLHAAKGLEWDTVFLAGLEEGFVPISHAETGGELAEERRLLYVGITRARRRLVLSWATTRQFGSRVSRRKPSRWLAPIEATIAELGRREQPKPRPDTIIDLRRPTVDRQREALRRRLDDWRTTVAQRSGAVPLAVLADDTLERIVEAAPEDDDALAALGLGPSHRRRYSAAICTIVRETATGETIAP